jgi:signal transduction histidine kinase
MARLGLATSGKTLGLVQGVAGWRPVDATYKVRRTALTALAVGALIAGLSATSVALQGVADQGVDYDETGQTVVDVARTGFAWSDGVRPGDIVISTIASGDPGGWSMVTRDGSGGLHTADGPTAYAGVAASLPVALVSLLLAGLAVLFLTTRRRWVVPVAAVALLAAADPIARYGAPDSSTLVLGAAAILPAINLGRRRPLGLAGLLGVGVALLVFIVAWAVARLTGAPSAGALEGLRGALAFWGTAALVIDRAVLPVLRGESIGVMRPRLFDVGVIASFAVVGVALMNLHVEPLLVGAMLVGVMAALPSTRRRFGEPIEEVLFGDVREAAAAEAAEAERARLARELHDVPLQELVAVIRRLEIKPGTEAESEDLRTLAGHLRNVASELRPPVLDDLGLPAALDYLAEESTSVALPVAAVIADDTGFAAELRPPSDVELAVYRIASEAVGNAVRHSGGSRVSITGGVGPDRIDVVISDDGAGLTPDRARDAAKHRRMGLASMRRRAQAIDAELFIDGTGGGTQVRVAWHA